MKSKEYAPTSGTAAISTWTGPRPGTARARPGQAGRAAGAAEAKAPEFKLHRQADAPHRRPRDRHRPGHVHPRRQARGHAHRQDPALAARRGRDRLDRPRPGPGPARGHGRPQARRRQGPLRRPAGRGRGRGRRANGRGSAGPRSRSNTRPCPTSSIGRRPATRAPRRSATASPTSRSSTSTPAATSRRASPRPTSSSSGPTGRLRGPPPDGDARQRRLVGGRPPHRLRLDPGRPRRPRRPGPGPQGPGRPTSRVIKNYMGGGFGSKLGLNEHTVVAANLARETGRPVKILLVAAGQRHVRRLPALVPADRQGRGEEGRHADRPFAR